MKTLSMAMALLLAVADFSLAESPPLSPAEVIGQLQRFYDSLQDFRATFRQSYFSRTLGRTKVSAGNLYTKKPGKMRWDYSQPSRRHFLIDGRRLMVYDPELEQVMVDEDFAGSELTGALSFLLGQGKLAESFAAVFDQRQDLVRKDSYLLKLDPRKPTVFRTLWLVVRREDFQVQEVYLEDAAGNTNHLVFSAVRTNRGLQDKVFELIIPPGVEVIKAPSGTQALQP